MKFPAAGPTALALSALAGWTLGQRSAAPDAATSPEPATVTAAAGADSRETAPSPSDIAQLVRSASREELKALVTQHSGRWNFRDTAIAMLATRRLRALDPASETDGEVYGETADRLRALAEKDPQAAIAQATAEDTHERSFEYGAIAAGWAQKDTAAGTAWALSLGAELNWPALDAIAEVLAEKSVEAAKAWVEALPDRTQAASLAERVAKKWAESAPVEATKWFASLNRSEAVRFAEDVVSRRTDWTAQELMQLYSHRDNPAYPPGTAVPERLSWSRDSLVIGEGGGAWLDGANLHSADPAALVNDLAAMPASEARQHLLRAAVQAWAARDPAAVLTAAESATDSWTRVAFLNGVLANDALIDSPETLARLAALAPTAMAADWVTARFWQERAKEHPAEAEQQLAGTLSDNATKMLAGSLAHEKSTIDPAAAVAWASGLVGAAQEGALASAATQWAEQDPQAATAWLATQPAGAGRDLAIKATISVLDPAEALPWAESISDPRFREETLRGYLLNVDPPERALRFVDRLETATPDFKANLRNLLKHAR